MWSFCQATAHFRIILKVFHLGNIFHMRSVHRLPVLWWPQDALSTEAQYKYNQIHESVHSPKPSDSNKHVSPTPTSRHQDRKLAVLSRAKKDPDGAVRRHGILRLGITCLRHKQMILKILIKMIIHEDVNVKPRSTPEQHGHVPKPISPPFPFSTSAERLLFQPRMEELFAHISIWEMAGQNSGATLPGSVWLEIRWHSHPPRPPTWSLRGDLCALLWFYTGYVRLCYEKRCDDIILEICSLCGYFSFLSRLSLSCFCLEVFTVHPCQCPIAFLEK